MRIRPPKLSTRLLLIVLAAGLPGIGLVAVNAFSHRRALTAEAGTRASEVASLLAQSHEAALESTQLLLAALAPLTDELLSDPAECARTLGSLLRRDRRLADIGIASADGTVLCSGAPSATDSTFGDRRWLAAALTEEDVVAGAPEMVHGQPVVTVAYARKPENERVHVLAASIDLNALAAHVASAPVPDGTALTLIDSAGTVLARHPDPAGWTGRSVRDEPLAQAALAASDRVARIPGLDGVERFYAFRPMPGSAPAAARLVVGIPMTRMLARADAALWRSLVTLLIVLLIALLLSHYTARRLILGPAEILVRAADRLRAGDLSARAGIPLDDEGGRVAAAFDAMAGRMEAQTVELERSGEALRQLARRTEDRVERERRRIARVVHDDFGQALTALKLDTSWLAQRIDGADAAMRDHLNAMQTLLESTSASVRRLTTELRPAVLDDLGLDAAVEWQAQEFSRRTGIATEAQLHVGRVRLSGETSIALYRILQEALANVARHAQAAHVRISLTELADRVVLEVTDDGIGISAKPADAEPSLGILGMRERAEALGGTLTIDAATPRGTTVRADVPLHGSASPECDLP